MPGTDVPSVIYAAVTKVPRAQETITDVELKRDRAGGDAGLLDYVDGSGAIKIGEGVVSPPPLSSITSHFKSDDLS